MTAVVELDHCGINYRFHHNGTGGIIWGAHNAGKLYEQDLLEAIAARRRPGVYVDVGAGIGNHSRFFSDACPSSLVVAVEPAPIALALLELNLEHAKVPCRIIQGFLTDRTELRWVLRRGVLRPSDGVAVALPRDAQHGVRLDSVVARDGEVGVIKIDVEGHEPRVLGGATKTLTKFSPLIAMEAWNDEAIAEQTAVLAPLGYRREPQRYCATPTYLWTKKEERR